MLSNPMQAAWCNRKLVALLDVAGRFGAIQNSIKTTQAASVAMCTALGKN